MANIFTSNNDTSYSASADGIGSVSNYLGTTYMLSHKKDFEPRKNIRLYIQGKV